MNLLIVDTDGVGLAFAWRAAQAGHAVRWFVKPKPSNSLEMGNGFKGIERIENWVGSMKWADLVFTTSNDDYLKRLDFFKSNGVMVFAPSQASADLEIKRGLGMEFLKKHGIDVPPYKIFKSLKEAEAYVWKNERRFVFKTLGDNEDKSLSYCGKSPADMIARLQLWQKTGMNPKGEVMLQEFISGIEMGVSHWMGSKGWVGKPNENFEHKKLMPGDAGPNCYSEDTEVLTNRGWLKFSDVKFEDEVASHDPESGEMFFERPIALHWTEYNGRMVHFKNRYVDLLVTPTHQMWGARRKTKNFQFYDADKTPSEFVIKQCAPARFGLENPSVRIAAHASSTGPKRPEKIIPMDLWCTFLGLYLSEGFCTPGKVFICQNPGEKSERMGEMLRKFPWKVKRHAKGWVIYSTQLCIHLSRFGLSRDKYAPDEVKAASKENINRFLDAFLMGDGDLHYGRRRFHSGSWRLISDIQELLQRIGSTGVITTDKRTEMVNPINGKTYPANPVYSIEETTRSEVSIRKKKSVQYSGMIGCVTLPSTHLLVVRRNGRVAICGNTGEMGTVASYVEKSKLFDDILRPLEKPLLKLDHVGDVDLNCIIDEKGKAWPLEFTSRPGWPIFNLMLAAHKGDPCQWMLDALRGKDTLEVNTEPSICVVLTQPDFPYGQFDKKEISGLPIYGVTKKNYKYVQPQRVQIMKLPDMEGEKVVERPTWATAGDYLAVVTGFGKTIKQAADRAYKTVDEISVPNMIYRNDIGAGLKDKLPKLQAMGYATHFTYE